MAFLAIPVIAADNGSDFSFGEMLKPKESYQTVKESNVGKPIEKVNNFTVGAVICILFLALLIALAKYAIGKPETSANGLMGMTNLVTGAFVFMICGIMIFAILTWT
jgi:hypothetical protein